MLAFFSSMVFFIQFIQSPIYFMQIILYLILGPFLGYIRRFGPRENRFQSYQGARV